MKPTYRRALNNVPTLFGCERNLFIAGMFVGLGEFIMFSSLIVGLVAFGIFATLGYFKANDPAVLRLLLNPGRYKAIYDPAQRKPFVVHIYDLNN